MSNVLDEEAYTSLPEGCRPIAKVIDRLHNAALSLQCLKSECMSAGHTPLAMEASMIADSLSNRAHALEELLRQRVVSA
jgi:hypothetical protein